MKSIRFLAFACIFANSHFVSVNGNYNMEEQMDLMEGDIMGMSPALEDYEAGDATNTRFMWPQNTVPYVFETNYPAALRQIFERAIRHLMNFSCLRFVPRTDQRDYVRVIQAGGCWSYVGRMGGAQNMSLIPQCTFGSFVHEILHAIGFQHEQARFDRNNYVTINWQNILPGREHNFNIHRTNLRSTYDYSSLMHYSSRAFSRNGQETITPRQRTANIGQRASLSWGDIKEINKMYCGWNY